MEVPFFISGDATAKLSSLVITRKPNGIGLTEFVCSFRHIPGYA